jgi:hypothetical protein
LVANQISIHWALVGENKIVQQVGRVDITVRCMVVHSSWKRVRVKMDLVAPRIAMGALKCSETSMMRVTDVLKRPFNMTPSLEWGYCQGKRWAPNLSLIIAWQCLFLTLMFTFLRLWKMSPLCPQVGQGVPWRIIAIRKQHYAGFFGMAEQQMKMMNIGR